MATTALGFGILGIVLAGLNIVLALTTHYVVIGWLSLLGLVAIPLGIVAAVKAASVKRPVGMGVTASVLGGVALVLTVVAFIVSGVGLTDTITESQAIPADEGYAQGFELFEKGTVQFTVEGRTSDSFTACIVEEARTQAWVDDVTPASATGHGCRGPGHDLSSSTQLAKGNYNLVMYCWNTSGPCNVTYTITFV